MKRSKISPGSNLLWEGSRMILPEHREAFLEQKRRQEWEERNRKPELDDQELERMGYIISEAYHENRTVNVKYWRDGVRAVRGVIREIRQDKFKVVFEDDWEWVGFGELIDVE